MFDKLFGKGKKKEEAAATPVIPFGRYSDNNKPPVKVTRWTDAENLFREKKYENSLDAFFDYLGDDSMRNVVYERNEAAGRFELYQGSKIVRGSFDKENVHAEVTLAKMPQPSVPVMRRLLEMNFSLYYSRFALDNDRVCMRFDTRLDAANPSKLYYGLKELATRGDKQDDLLVQDFSTLQTTGNDHIADIAAAEKEIKYSYFQQWIKQTLDLIATLDADKFSGGIAYMLLGLAYRIDYLVTPEGRLMYDIERIAGIYFQKNERPVTEKNRDMAEEFKKLQSRTKDEIFTGLYRSKYTFSIVAPQHYKAVTDSIQVANQNTAWYRDNNYPSIANQVTEYGISYCQYSFSLPKAITELYHLFMMVNYPEFFVALGARVVYYDPVKKQFASQSITDKIRSIQETWKVKYPGMDFRIQQLRFDSLVNFNISFTNELSALNMEAK